MKYLLLLLVFFINSDVSKITGYYTARSFSGYSWEPVKRGKYLKEEANYNKHHLIINDDSSFYYEFRHNVKSTRSSSVTRKCKGSWKRNVDTLILNSKYQDSDFVRVEEFFDSTLRGNILQVCLRSESPFSWCNRALITLNNSYVLEDCSVDDTVYTKRRELESVRFNFYPIRFEYLYEPTNKNFNVLEVDALIEIDEDNYYMCDWKMLVSEDKLIPIDNKNTFKVQDSFQRKEK